MSVPSPGTFATEIAEGHDSALPGVFRLYWFAGQCLLSFPKRSVVPSV